ncbi:hypothetical protein LQZ19_19075 [Treponema primitia]|uniref:hypothetical protein n=1 Tax=Treponema primitia TaxID=88058 RepID=UPI00397EECD0
MRMSKLGLLLILCTYAGFGADFGVTLSVLPEYDSRSDREFSFTGTLSPWVSALLSPTLGLYVSAAARLEYDEPPDPFLIELDRTELSWRPVSTVFLQLGRQWFEDKPGLIASGLFDGVQGSLGLGDARLSLGVFYTGFLYKETAKVIMNNHDLEMYGLEPDYGDMSSYFASKRVLVPFTVEFPGFTARSSLALSAIAQFDVNGRETADSLQSQYLEFQYILEPREPLHLTIAASAGLRETDDMRMGFAALARVDFEPPTAVQDLLSLQLRWSSGRGEDFIDAYFPVSSIPVGEIFPSRLSGLMYIKSAYMVRPHKSFSAEAGLSYYIRTDLTTLQDREFDPPSDSRLLGGECYGSLVWAPQSLIRLSAEGGLFFPNLGGVFISGTELRWKAALGAVVSF